MPRWPCQIVLNLELANRYTRVYNYNCQEGDRIRHRKEGNKMKSNLTIKEHSEMEAQEDIANLKRYGYKRISNCYWYERWEKDNWIVEIERDF